IIEREEPFDIGSVGDRIARGENVVAAGAEDLLQLCDIIGTQCVDEVINRPLWRVEMLAGRGVRRGAAGAKEKQRRQREGAREYHTDFHERLLLLPLERAVPPIASPASATTAT